MQQVIFSGVPYSQVLEDIGTVLRREIQNLLSSHIKPEAESPDQLLTVREVSELLSITVQTVHLYKKQGILPYYKIAGRTYLKRPEVVAALQSYQRTIKGRKGIGRA